MKAKFIAQPLRAFGGWTASWLLETLRDPNITRLDLAVAWIKRSGLARFRDDFVAFHRRGGVASAILGIDEGGATVQGLRLANELFDRVHIYYEPGRRRTFHPKVYLASGAECASLLIASSNLTAGGLFSNYEAALACQLELGQEEDRKLVTQVQAWLEALYSDSSLCLPLTDDLLASVVGDPRYRVRDEDRSTRADLTKPDDYDGVALADTHELFGQSILRRAGFPPSLHVSDRRQGTARGSPRVTHKPRADRARVRLRWWKQMSAADAQHPTGRRTNVTGNLKLAKARHSIDQRSFFVDRMFRDADWETRQMPRGPLRTALIPFDVTIDGSSLGEVQLKVDHAEFRIAHQGNIPTWLHWMTLGAVLRQNDHTGAWVILEALSDGRFRLTITRTEPESAG